MPASSRCFGEEVRGDDVSDGLEREMKEARPFGLKQEMPPGLEKCDN